MLKVVLVGAGGYAANYVNHLQNPEIATEMQLISVVDPYAKASSVYDKFKDLVPVYDHLNEFFAAHKADLAIISTPIHLHFEQCMIALDNGAHVYCEKPLVPTLDELNRLEQKCKEVGKTLSVGFQRSYSAAVRKIKERILAGEFGKPLNFKTLVSWPRGWDYYGRASWAGKRANESGGIVNDSVISNATAHHIHNMLFLLGANMEESAPLQNMQAECYKANDIETFDTIALRGKVGGADIFYTASHAVNYHLDPMCDFRFENARIITNLFNQDWKTTIHHANGRVEEVTYPEDGDQTKLLMTAASINGLQPLACGIETVRPFTALIDSIFADTTFVKFNEAFVIRDNDEKRTYVKNLHLDLLECFNLSKLPSELGFYWRTE